MAEPPRTPRMALATAISTFSTAFHTDLFIGIEVLKVIRCEGQSVPM